MSTTNDNVAEIVKHLDMPQESEEKQKIIINPYNFNNKLINKYQLEALLRTYGVETGITNMSYYHEAFSHKSYCKKEELKNKEDVEIDKKLAIHPPSDRSRKSNLIDVRCRACNKSEAISASLVPQEIERYICNRCQVRGFKK